MYRRIGRFSLYMTRNLFWLRLRDKEMLPKGFFFRVGLEV